MATNDYMVEEMTGVVRNLVAPLKISEGDKAEYVSKMVDEVFLEAYTGLCAKKDMKVEFGDYDPLEITASQIEPLMAEKFELEEILESLAFHLKILSVRFMEEANFTASDVYDFVKQSAHTIKE